MVERLLEASSAIDAWLSSNRLRLNPDKTQFIWLGGRLQLNKIDTDSLHFRFPHIHFSSSVRDLGIVVDPSLSFTDQVNSVSRSCFYHLRQLRSIRSSLSLHAITTLIHALICTRVDFGNAAYIGLSASNTHKLQSILNAAARLIGGIPKFPISQAIFGIPFTGSLSNSGYSSKFFPSCVTALLGWPHPT